MAYLRRLTEQCSREADRVRLKKKEICANESADKRRGWILLSVWIKKKKSAGFLFTDLCFYKRL